MRNYLLKTFVTIVLITICLLAYCGGTDDIIKVSKAAVADSILSDSSFIFDCNDNGRRAEIKSRSGRHNEYCLNISDDDNSGYLNINFPQADSLYLIDEKAHLTSGDFEHVVYLKSPEKLEWEMVFYQAPDSAELTFTIATENLIFYYQPPETLEAHRNDWQFSDDIPGSYAVFYRDSYGMETKAFHLYRPKAWDSGNDTAWCELTIDTQQKLLKVELPDNFINEAVYPITVDPTFGYTTKGGIGVSMDANNYSHRVNYGYPCAASGSLETALISAYRTSEATSCTVTVTVYSYDSTLADCNKIAVSAKKAVPKTSKTPDGADWETISISGTLVAGNSYIVSWQGSEDYDSSLYVCADYINTSEVERRYNYDEWGTNDNLAGYSSNNFRYSVVVEYTESSAEDGMFIRRRKIKRGY